MQNISTITNLSNPKRQDNRMQNISSVINLSNPKRQDNRVQNIQCNQSLKSKSKSSCKRLKKKKNLEIGFM